MYTRFGTSLAAALLVAACGGAGETADEGPPQAVADSAAAPGAPDAHAMHDTPAGVDSSAMHGMDHSAHAAAPATGGSAAVDHSAHAAAPAGGRTAAVDHSAHAAAPAGGGSAAVDHSAHAAARAGGRTGAVDHSAHAAAPARRGTAAVDHSAHVAAPARRGTAAVDHSAHAAAPAAGRTAAVDHSAHAVAPPARVDEATQKLLELAGELVRDPAVQREIQRDPELREAWSDPAVRRVVVQQP